MSVIGPVVGKVVAGVAGAPATSALSFSGGANPTYIDTLYVPDRTNPGRIEADLTPTALGTLQYPIDQLAGAGSGGGVAVRINASSRPRGSWFNSSYNSSALIFTQDQQDTVTLSWPGVSLGVAEINIVGQSAESDDQGSGTYDGILRIGARNNADTQGFIGVIHEVRVYDAYSGGTMIHQWTINTGNSTIPDTGSLANAPGTVVLGDGAWS